MGLYWVTIDGVRQWVDGDPPSTNSANNAVTAPNPACPPTRPQGTIPLPTRIPGWEGPASNDPNFTPDPGSWLRFGRGLISIVGLPFILTGDTPQAPSVRWIEGDYEYEFLEGPQTVVVRERPGFIDMPMLRDVLAQFDVETYLGDTYFEDGIRGITGVIDPESGVVSDAYISPEGMPFPSEENYRVARQQYENYLDNGGTLSFEDWLTQGRPEAENIPSSGRYTVSPSRREHILEGDPPGTGHGPNRGNNDGAFPDTWSDDQAINAIERIANSPNSTWKQSNGSGYQDAPVTRGGPASDAPTHTSRGRPVRFRVRGRDHGITIEVIVEPGGEGIITGYRIPD